MLVHVISHMNYWALTFRDEFHDLILFAVPAEFIVEGKRRKRSREQALEPAGGVFLGKAWKLCLSFLISETDTW